MSIQRTLGTCEWPGVGRLRVRMGLNTGVADARDDDFFGPEVIRAARLCAAANAWPDRRVTGRRRAGPHVSWIDLGSHRLRGFATPVEIHQVVADGIDSRFPALRTLDAHPNTLPRFHTEFFGREEEIAAIAQLLSSQRLVTLTGVGGSGKTRLAVEVAHDQLGSFDGGAYFADLSVGHRDRTALERDRSRRRTRRRRRARRDRTGRRSRRAIPGDASRAARPRQLRAPHRRRRGRSRAPARRNAGPQGARNEPRGTARRGRADRAGALAPARDGRRAHVPRARASAAGAGAIDDEAAARDLRAPRRPPAGDRAGRGAVGAARARRRSLGASPTGSGC